MKNLELGEYKDFSYLIKEVYDIIGEFRENFIKYPLLDKEECEKFCYGHKSVNNEFLVLAEDTSVELGAPDKKSASIAMWSKEGLDTGRTLYIAGEELFKLQNDSVSFIQLAIIKSGNNLIDDFKISRLLGMNNKIPGFMTRSMSGRIWVRIHKNLAKKEFTFYSLGQCIYKALNDAMPEIFDIDIVLVAGKNEIIDRFLPVIDAARLISSTNKTIKLVEDGIITCDDLNCDACYEKPACNTLKSIVAKRKTLGSEI